MNTIKFSKKVGYFSLVALLFVALIMRAYVHMLDPFTGKLMFKEMHLDLFSHGKAVFLCAFVGIALFAGVLDLWGKKDRINLFKKTEYYIVGFMMMLVLISTAFSAYPGVALNGFMDRYEGMWVWLAYLSIPLLVRLFVDDLERIKAYGFYLVMAVSLPFLIGTFQYLGYDMITQNWFRYLVFPLDKINEFGPIELATPSVYTTLYNQNFVGGLVALTLPLTWYLYSVMTSKVKQGLVVLASAVATISLVGANSSAGYIAYIMICFAYTLKYFVLDTKWSFASALPHVVSVTIAIVLGATNTLARTEVITSYKLYVAVTALSFLGVVIIALLKKFVSADFFKRKSTILIVAILIVAGGLFSVSTLLRGDVQAAEPTQSVEDPAAPRDIIDIQSDGKRVTIMTDRDQLTIANVNGQIAILDKEGKDLPLKSTEFSNSFVPELPEYAGYALNIYSDNQLMEVLINGFHNGLADQQQILIQMRKDGVSVAGLDAQPIEIVNAPSIGFKGNEDFATNRGYIWSRTLPLILQSPIIGHGADTFPLYFPQYDIGKFMIANNFFYVIDKPHNAYIQMTFAFGIFFLIGYLSLLVYTVKGLIQRIMTHKDALALTLVITLVAFSIIAVINDSVIEVNPYLWIIFGISISYININSEASVPSKTKTARK